jgi:drug/metabolite transporter (DMT)-like permease
VIRRQNAPVTSRPAPGLLAVGFALFVLYVVWGSTYLAISYAIETIPPLLGAGGRFLLAGGVLFGLLGLRGALRGERIDARTWRSAAIVGIALLVGGNGLVVLAEQTIPSGITALLVATVPIWMAFFESVVSRRRPSLLVLGGLAAGFIGVAMLVAPTGAAQLDIGGMALGLASPICWAAGSVYARRTVLPRSPFVTTAMEMVVGGVTLLALAGATGEVARFDPGAASTESIVALGYLVLFGSLAGFTAYIWLLHNVSPTTASTYAYVNPVVAIALGAWIRDEPIGPRTIIAAAIIVAAVVAMVSGRFTQAAPDSPPPKAAHRSITDA